jgi:hypothetical protein
MANEAENSGASESVQELVDQLVTRAEARGDGCVELSELSELTQEAELGMRDRVELTRYAIRQGLIQP